ncbi:MAG TPA: ABC-F family ATP-binding cassette domain-containing protein, partial [Anaerolineaceae bacterium]|nr:ABC-F family ATP-binding cassette domain-containing protein [Anaerolineaceae bacterium]
MTILSTQNLGRAFGAVDVFDDINIAIPQNARIAIVGPNGVGKTTLLRILAGEDSPSQGSVHSARGLKIAYLPQTAVGDIPGTLWDFCLMAFENLLEMGAQLQTLERRMANGDDSPELLQDYGKLQTRFDDLGGYTYISRLQHTLSGLGFDESDFYRPLNQLSGGQRTRARLAKLLLEDPDLLLLDEPTNHLDIQAVEWLEAWLRAWKGAAIIVSHDRYFLDQTASWIWEMTPAIEEYRGNYTAYLHQRQERYQRRLAEYKAQQEYIEKQEDYIKRFIDSQNTAQARGRRKRLERLMRDSLLTNPDPNVRPMHLRLKVSGRSGQLVLRTYDLEVGYHDEGKPLFSTPDLVLERTECVAIIGPNGAGKTTFLRTILGQIPPYSGETELGASLNVGYFAQAHEDLIESNNLIEEINREAPRMLPGEVRDYLAKYGFQEDDVFATVSTLSGGERGRLALAKLALSDANLLLLDEPTNHLDHSTQEVLQKVLQDYPGTILLVSHDRYLIDALATQIWELLPDEGRLQVFKGSYSEYKEFKQAQAA